MLLSVNRGFTEFVKEVYLNFVLCVSDLFANMVPVPVHQAMAAFDVRKNEIVNLEINKLRESTQTLNRLHFYDYDFIRSMGLWHL